MANALLALLLAAAVLVVSPACGSSEDDAAATLQDPDRTGGELVAQYLALVHRKDVEGLEAFLSDAFIIQRADGSYFGKADYVGNLPDIGEYRVSEVTALQTDDSLVVRWTLAVEQVINGVQYSGDAAPRLSTFVFEDGGWRLFSHANFNVPAGDN
jgi:hypothetical protein